VIHCEDELIQREDRICFPHSHLSTNQSCTSKFPKSAGGHKSQPSWTCLVFLSVATMAPVADPPRSILREQQRASSSATVYQNPSRDLPRTQKRGICHQSQRRRSADRCTAPLQSIAGQVSRRLGPRAPQFSYFESQPNSANHGNHATEQANRAGRAYCIEAFRIGRPESVSPQSMTDSSDRGKSVRRSIAGPQVSVTHRLAQPSNFWGPYGDQAQTSLVFLGSRSPLFPST